MNDDMRAYLQSVDWHALAEKRLREDDLAAHVADEAASVFELLNRLDPDATPLTKQLRSRGYMSLADSIRLARYEEAQQAEGGSRRE